jgi:hypothetical protein
LVFAVFQTSSCSETQLWHIIVFKDAVLKKDLRIVSAFVGFCWLGTATKKSFHRIPFSYDMYGGTQYGAVKCEMISTV